ncbi:MAG TPA: 4a-hydroxytetrahydrobiopterin dehydratase [Polyangiaceae bacterium]|nr:4a-hydroxytetrahydrobiopterin dehydratase [Polyangiaceae bacterium]
MRPGKLDNSSIDAWLQKHGAWTRTTSAGGQDALARNFSFKDFSEALAFVVRVGCAAERRDHHPDVELGWGRARVLWSTHDAGGISTLDLELAEATDGFAP